MPVALNLQNTAAFLVGLPTEKLGGLAEAVTAKATELGQGPVALKVPADPNRTTTGNVRGVLRFVESLNADSSDEDKAKLGVLVGLLATKVAPPKTATRRGRRGRRRRG